jgi:hypothetical protein
MFYASFHTYLNSCEEAIRKDSMTNFADGAIKCFSFHIDQTWWRKIQTLELIVNYCDTEAEIGKLDLLL